MLLRIVDRLRAARENEDGFTIIEVMVAMTVFAIIAAGVAAGIVSTMYLTQDNRSREAALNLANQALDAARSTKDVFTLDDDTRTQTVGTQGYTVKRTTNWINSDGTDNSCGAGSGVLSYKRVAITVSWTSGTSPRQKNVVLDTLISPPAAVSSASGSTIVVGVRTASGGPNENVAVNITPVSGGATSLAAQPAATDGNGCSYALGVTPGTYKIAISKSGNVDESGATAPTYNITTTAGGIGNKSFLYDQALSVSVGAPLNLTQGTAKLPTSMTTSFRHADRVSTISTTSTTLFPYTDGWTAVAGSYTSTCKDVDPTEWTTPVNNLVVSPNIFTDVNGQPGVLPTSATTATARAPMGIIDVKMSGIDTVLVATVKNTTAVSGGDPGCSPSTTYYFTGLKSTAATTVALPYGTWTLRGTTALAGLLSSNNPVVAANPNVTNVNVSVSGNVVTLDPRIVSGS
ncbi:prepilin-type N-terminal cleavage/methylation domain-containing protein [Curtobacterium sp. PhB130]|uniref:type IV pilus modification PilV family protein n=1 Tax=unclassified Curtobacterium TaxID=257496 RepID=UPI000F4BF5E0|nr:MULTISPECIES: prepilin-type N-terminal cleavage/methylation domain-containing protein [unclassified Curtobacterium]ROS77558.1 prepilin-type N-terminal cleavage/methylation domain-containing protein [Curtobacterium sp. PhB130]TCK66235.1 prepilin-type N-terminal cleavage/methylation domain-containing protein [Curtobacterium sp. PhB136]